MFSRTFVAGLFMLTLTLVAGCHSTSSYRPCNSQPACVTASPAVVTQVPTAPPCCNNPTPGVPTIVH
jgi:hypothetical protein